MPIARYQLPDGRIARFEVPDGTTPEQAQQIGDQYFAENPTPAAEAQSAPAPAREPQAPAPDVDVSRLGRFAHGAMKVPEGISQAAMNFLPRNFIDRGNDLIGKANDLPVIGPLTKAAGIIPESPEQYGQRLTKDEGDFQAARKAAGQDGIDWAGAAGTMLASVPLSMAMPGVSGGLLAKTGMAAAEGGLLGAAQPVYGNGDFANEKAKQAGIGAAAGGLLTPVTAAVGRVISPKVNDAVKGLLSEGITPTPGQILGGIPARFEERLTSVPFTGDVVRSGMQRATNQLNTAAINRSLAPIGETLPKGLSGREAISYADARLRDTYDNVLDKIGAVQIDQQFGQGLNALSGMTRNLPKDIGEQFDRIVKNEIVDRIDANGVMTSSGLKAAESNLGEIARGYMRNQDYDKRMLGDAVLEAQSSIKQMLERQSPQYAPELRAVNRGWANFLRPQRAASSLGAEDGVFTAAQLQNAVKALDPSKNKRAFAKGDSFMQDLSDPAKKVLGGKIPDSGTAGRLMNAGLFGLTSGALTSPLALAYTPAGQRAVAGLLAQRPAIAAPIAGLLERYSPAISASGAVMAPGLLGQQ